VRIGVVDQSKKNSGHAARQKTGHAGTTASAIRTGSQLAEWISDPVGKFGVGHGLRPGCVENPRLFFVMPDHVIPNT
jgi:hypothetical protein